MDLRGNFTTNVSVDKEELIKYFGSHPPSGPDPEIF